MLPQGQISVGRLREAYNLTSNEADAVVQALWPDAVFHDALWLKAYETCWKDFLRGYQEIYKRADTIQPPTLSLPNNRFNSSMFALDLETFFRRLSFRIPSHPLLVGLNGIIEDSYDNADRIFQDDIKILFDSLQKLEKIGDSNIYSPDYPYFEDSNIGIASSYYHFIVKLYPDTILIEQQAAIKYLRDCPLCKEVKGITHRIVESILAEQDKPTTNLECSTDAADIPDVEQTEDGKLTFRIPSSIWLGRTEEAVRDAMLNIYPLPVIAYVLFNWCGKPEANGKNSGGRKTRIGRLLSDKEYTDTKSYRNLVNALLQEASAYQILQS